MTIFEILDGILSTFDVPYYDHMPEFAEGEEDELCISYNLYDVPSLFGDGAEDMTEYHVTVSVFGYNAQNVDSLYDSVISALKNEGFCRQGGVFSKSNDFPAYYRKSGELSFEI